MCHTHHQDFYKDWVVCHTHHQDLYKDWVDQVRLRQALHQLLDNCDCDKLCDKLCDCEPCDCDKLCDCEICACDKLCEQSCDFGFYFSFAFI